MVSQHFYYLLSFQRLQHDIFYRVTLVWCLCPGLWIYNFLSIFSFIIKLLLKKIGSNKHYFDIGLSPLSFFLREFFRHCISERCLGNLQTQGHKQISKIKLYRPYMDLYFMVIHFRSFKRVKGKLAN